MRAWTRAVTLDRRPIDVTLEYTRQHGDVVDFHFAAAQPVTWRVGRDLLNAGLTAHAGHCDVRVTPTMRGLGIHLNTPAGRAYLLFDPTHIAGFLKATYRLVPRGHEYDRLDWDAFPGLDVPAGGA